MPSRLFIVVIAFALALSLRAADSPAPAMRILRDRCVGCHKPGKAKGGLLLTTYEKMMKGGDNGTPVVPGKAADSLLYQSVLTGADPHMPPKKQLPDSEVATFKAWIDAGAKWDAAIFDEPPAAKPVKLSAMPQGCTPVLAIALAPDEKKLAAARGNTILIIDLAGKEPAILDRLDGHTEVVQSLVWSADGKYIISGGWQRILVWDGAAMKLDHAVAGSIGVQAPAAQDGAALVGNITALVLNKAATTLYAADGEPGGAGFIRKIDLAQNKLIATWKAHEDTVYSIRLSPKEDQLLSGGADRLAKIWDVAANKLVAFYEGHTNHILSVAFNNDATQIATAGADKEVKVWDVKSREQDVSLGDKKTVFTGLAWSPDGKALAAVTDKGTGSVYSALQKHDGTQRSDTGKERRLAAVDDDLTAVAITADGKTVVAGGFSGKVHIWDGTTGKEASVIEAK